MKAIAVIFLVLFVISLPLSLALMKIDTLLFDTQIYQEALERVQPETQVPALLAQEAVKSSASSGSFQSLRGLEAQSFQALLEKLVTPQQFHDTTQDLVMQALDYVQMKRDSISISFTAFRQSLDTTEGVAYFKEFLQAYPKCTGQQLEAMLKESKGKPDNLTTLCKPPREYHSAHGDLVFADFLPGQVTALVATIPEDVVLIQAPAAGQDFRPQLQKTRQQIRYSYLVPVVLLLLGLVFAVRSFKGWLAWCGFPLAFAGLLGLLAGKLAGPLLSTQVDGLLAGRLSALPAVVMDYARDVAGSMLALTLEFLASRSILFLIAGIVLLAGALILHKMWPAVKAPPAPQA